MGRVLKLDQELGYISCLNLRAQGQVKPLALASATLQTSSYR